MRRTGYDFRRRTGPGGSVPLTAPVANGWGVAMRRLPVILLAVLASCTGAAPALAASTAFRITDLDLRDPHLFVDFIGCRDITDISLAGSGSVNGNLQKRIQADSTGDGLLDLSLLVVFDPLDAGGAGSPMRFGESSCTAPMTGTTCGPIPFENLQALGSTNAVTGQCLSAIAGTIKPYTPAITTSTSPCFVSAEAPLILLPIFEGMSLPLRAARLAATWSGGSPATALANGLLSGFVTELDANNTIFPASTPLLGGMPLSMALPGGDPPGPGACCAAHSDLDLGPSGERGWWMYFNFTAQAVTYTGPSVGVGDDGDGAAKLAVASANPGRGQVAIAYRLEADGPATVSVHDLAGRRVATPASGWHRAGAHQVAWDGRLGSGAAAGIYVIRLASTRGTIARKVVLLR